MRELHKKEINNESVRDKEEKELFKHQKER